MTALLRQSAILLLTLQVVAAMHVFYLPTGADPTLSATLPSCHDVAGAKVTCGSHCWPNCPSHSGEAHSEAMDFNHYVVVPEEKSCFISTVDYGRFDFYLSKDSLVTATAETYVFSDGVCTLNETGVELSHGAFLGDQYC
mmetsp:Transcript_11486/g.17282  ORF Transcript_11486/g.17282 Transcript_11486/m.17282 type:complete len:140 (+) Transcript_11486:3-422(+)